jgi:hypothetical protein
MLRHQKQKLMLARMLRQKNVMLITPLLKRNVMRLLAMLRISASLMQSHVLLNKGK